MKQREAIIFVMLTMMIFIASCQNKYKSALPKPDHIVILIEENHSYDQIMGSGNAPYFDTLAEEGALFTNSHAITHPSQPNYLALFSGNTQGVTGDDCLKDSTPFSTPNLGAALIKAGYTFKGYAESLPSTAFLDCDYAKVPGYDYARKHAPWVNWIGDKENNMSDSVNQPLTNFPTEYDQLPTVCFVIPNEANDMHNIGLFGDTASMQRASQWVKDHLGEYINWAKTHNSLFILTFDEDQGDDLNPNQIPTIFAGQMVKPGKYDDSIDHYNVLRTIEAMYDIPRSGNAKETAIKNVWK
jgi:acid phosphatase